jgi:hypothetical protein
MWRYIDSSEHSKLLIGKERRLWDNTRVDILTDQWAVEVDWADKWSEAIGQSLWYSCITGKKPGICLLIRDMSQDFKHIYRCNVVTVKYKIDIWLVDTQTSIAILPDGKRILI